MLGFDILAEFLTVLCRVLHTWISASFWINVNGILRWIDRPLWLWLPPAIERLWQRKKQLTTHDWHFCFENLLQYRYSYIVRVTTTLVFFDRYVVLVCDFWFPASLLYCFSLPLSSAFLLLCALLWSSIFFSSPLWPLQPLLFRPFCCKYHRKWEVRSQTCCKYRWNGNLQHAER